MKIKKESMSAAKSVTSTKSKSPQPPVLYMIDSSDSDAELFISKNGSKSTVVLLDSDSLIRASATAEFPSQESKISKILNTKSGGATQHTQRSTSGKAPKQFDQTINSAPWEKAASSFNGQGLSLLGSEISPPVAASTAIIQYSSCLNTCPRRYAEFVGRLFRDSEEGGEFLITDVCGCSEASTAHFPADSLDRSYYKVLSSPLLFCNSSLFSAAPDTKKYTN